MTLFEFLTVAVSIVLALGLARLVHGLRVSANPETRYWVHFGYIAWGIVLHALLWWSLWRFQSDVDWNFGRFLYVMIAPVLLYSVSSTLVPDNPAEIASWRDYFFSVRSSFFWVFTVFSLHQAFASTLVQGVPPLPAMRPVHAAAVTLPVIGALSASPRVHAFLLAGVVLTLVAAIMASFGPPARP